MNNDLMLFIAPKKLGYKTEKGLIRMIKSQNKKLTKLNCKVTFTITLPIREKKNEQT